MMCCPDCLENSIEGGFNGLDVKGCQLAIENEFTYLLTCDKGHQYIAQLQAFPFEVLFESGLIAHVNGFYLESVLSFKAALERFYEFYINIICRARNIDADKLDNAYKQISNNSEREYGAFVFMYFQANNDIPELLPNKSVEFRNKVVHKGYFPKKEEALRFARNIYKMIKPIYIELREKYDAEILSFLNVKRQEYYNSLIKANPKIKDTPISSQSLCLPLCIHHATGLDEFKERSFDEYYQNLLSRRPEYRM